MAVTKSIPDPFDLGSYAGAYWRVIKYTHDIEAKEHRIAFGVWASQAARDAGKPRLAGKDLEFVIDNSPQPYGLPTYDAIGAANPAVFNAMMTAIYLYAKARPELAGAVDA